MSPQNLQFWNRSTEFYNRIRSLRLDKAALIYAGGWLITFVLLFWPVSFLVNPLTFIAYFFCWFKLTDIVYRRLAPPSDLLILLFFMIFGFFSLLEPASPFGVPGNSLRHLVSLIILGMLVMIFSVLLVCNEKGKKGGLVAYTLLFYIGLNVVYHEEVVYLLLFQAFLFLVALRRTNWLEMLTKTECYLYFAAVVFVFSVFLDQEPYSGYSGSLAENAYAWIGLPKFLYYMFKMYLLAILVKIPLVLVYNFATLSRKLRISSFFQSTFPQIIQALMLFIIFYFTLAGWQAEKVRQASVTEVMKIIEGRISPGVTAFHTTRDQLGTELISLGYRPLQFLRPLPDRGVIEVQRNAIFQDNDAAGPDFFIFLRTPDQQEPSYHFVRLDSTFLQSISDHTSVLVGTHLRISPYEPPPWEAFFLNFDLLTEDKLRISPFGLLPGRDRTALRVPFVEELERSELNLERVGQRVPDTRLEFIVGRVIAPLFGMDIREAGFFVIEITLVPGGSTFLTPTLLSYVLLLIGAYLLINFFVIRRMTKFGSEINRIIVQKFSQLRSGIQEISAGNLDFRLHIEGRDEFVELADHFNEMGAKLKRSIAEVREKERLQQELAIARKVQLDLLPKRLPDIPGFEIAATLQTANEVGGDFYDVIPVSGDRFLVTIGDVSGKGTSAALYMAQYVSLLRYSHHFTDDPREIAIRLNHYFANPEIDRQIFVTAIIGVLDTGKNTFSFVRAGHLPPLLVNPDGAKPVEEIASQGLGLGLEAGKTFEKTLQMRSLTLEDGDVLVLFTDGIIEASKPAMSGEEETSASVYGEERLKTMLESLRGQPALEIERSLNLDINAFYDRSAFIDDYTILILRKRSL